MRGAGAWCIGRRLASVHDLEAALPRFKDAGPAFQSKNLLDAWPLFAKPVIQIGTARDLSMLQSPMTFVPRLRLPPAPPIRGAVGKQIGNILDEGGLIVRGLEPVGASTALHLRTQLGALVCIASRVTIRPLTREGVMSGLSALISCCFSPTLHCQSTVPVVTS